MGFSCGIIGLPNVGKSTIFNALTAIGVPAEAFPFCTIEPNIGKVAVPDERLSALADRIKPGKVTPTVMEFVDIAGLVKGASKGEGLGNQFLGHIRNVTAVAMVVRCFHDPDVAHVSDTIDPAGDMDVVTLELILADLQSVDRKMDKQSRLAKVGDRDARQSLEILKEVKSHLEAGHPARNLNRELMNSKDVRELFLLTAKPLLVVLNVSETDLDADSDLAAAARLKAESEQLETVIISGKIEAEIMRLDAGEQEEYRMALGLEENSLSRLIHAGYRLLGLITFYTTVGTELRAWTIPARTPAVTAAGRIHTDMERGFIRAEVLHYVDFERFGSEIKARESGCLHVEGRDYIVRDGDIVRFKFNV
ncbi:redox-regulated ATPase YchF [bacterium]|nr:redox-regulated ATPase YchF [candidate division CSSED10-310 bacterium]